MCVVFGPIFPFQPPPIKPRSKFIYYPLTTHITYCKDNLGIISKKHNSIISNYKIVILNELAPTKLKLQEMDSIEENLRPNLMTIRFVRLSVLFQSLVLLSSSDTCNRKITAD